MMTPAVELLAPAFCLLSDNALERTFRGLDVHDPRRSVPENLRCRCGLLVLWRGFIHDDDGMPAARRHGRPDLRHFAFGDQQSHSTSARADSDGEAIWAARSLRVGRRPSPSARSL